LKINLNIFLEKKIGYIKNLYYICRFIQKIYDDFGIEMKPCKNIE